MSWLADRKATTTAASAVRPGSRSRIGEAERQDRERERRLDRQCPAAPSPEAGWSGSGSATGRSPATTGISGCRKFRPVRRGRSRCATRRPRRARRTMSRRSARAAARSQTPSAGPRSAAVRGKRRARRPSRPRPSDRQETCRAPSPPSGAERSGEAGEAAARDRATHLTLPIADATGPLPLPPPAGGEGKLRGYATGRRLF